MTSKICIGNVIFRLEKPVKYQFWHKKGEVGRQLGRYVVITKNYLNNEKRWWKVEKTKKAARFYQRAAYFPFSYGVLTDYDKIKPWEKSSA